MFKLREVNLRIQHANRVIELNRVKVNQLHEGMVFSCNGLVERLLLSNGMLRSFLKKILVFMEEAIDTRRYS